MMGLSLVMLVLSLVVICMFNYFVNNCENWMVVNLVVVVDKGECFLIVWYIIEFVLNVFMVFEVIIWWIVNGRVCVFFVFFLV